MPKYVVQMTAVCCGQEKRPVDAGLSEKAARFLFLALGRGHNYEISGVTSE